MKVAAIIAAGGIGKRMGAATPKQYIEILGRPIICRTLDKFKGIDGIKEVIVVVPTDYVNSFKSDIIDRYDYPSNWQVTSGGLHRQDSVRNGLNLVSKDCDVVLVHDGVRPFVTAGLIEKSIEAAFREGAVIVAAPVKETIKKANGDKLISGTVDRQGLWGAQTPQVFRYKILKEAMESAYRDNFMGTDEASIVERNGAKVKIIEGDSKNIKITTPDDIVLAEAIAEHWSGRL